MKTTFPIATVLCLCACIAIAGGKIYDIRESGAKGEPLIVNNAQVAELEAAK